MALEVGIVEGVTRKGKGDAAPANPETQDNLKGPWKERRSHNQGGVGWGRRWGASSGEGEGVHSRVRTPALDAIQERDEVPSGLGHLLTVH